jgi:hypothetical protein
MRSGLLVRWGAKMAVVRSGRLQFDTYFALEVLVSARSGSDPSVYALLSVGAVGLFRRALFLLRLWTDSGPVYPLHVT